MKNKLPPKVASFIEAAKPILSDYSNQVTKVASLESASADVSAENVKLANDTADMLVRQGVISQDHHAKFASDLSNPKCAHTFIASLAGKYMESERNAAAPTLGTASQSKQASSDLSAFDQFTARLHSAS